MTANPESNDQGRRTKVERVIDEYGLDGLGTKLERFWTDNGDESRSLRELANLLNRRLLEQAMHEAEVSTVDGEVDNYYRLLRGENVSAGDRTEARSRLADAGIDIASLESDFVSHQAIHTYLTDRRGVQHEPRSPQERVSSGLESIRRLESRLETVATTVVEGAQSSDALDLGEFEILVTTTVHCRSCGRQHPATDLLERGNCRCRRDN